MLAKDKSVSVHQKIFQLLATEIFKSKTGVSQRKHKGNKKILHEIINQIEIINNSVTADRNIIANTSKET